MKDFDIEWEPYSLPNILIYHAQLPEYIMDRLWTYIDNADTNKVWNQHLAGNLESSLTLDDTDDFFANRIILPMSREYIKRSMIPLEGNHGSDHFSQGDLDSLRVTKLWVNFQNQHEFNPLHCHTGLLSFVIWMRIPTESEEQDKLPLTKDSNSKVASDFQFFYSDILGTHRDIVVPMGSKREGTIFIFPAKLRHQVYPFYNCDEKRVSISGNVGTK